MTFWDSVGLGFDETYDVSEEQVRFFREHGWVRLPGLLSRKATQAIRVPLAELDFRPPPDPNGAVFLKGARVDDYAAKAMQKHEGLAWKYPFFRELGTSRLIAGACVKLMDVPEALLVQDSSYFKPAFGGETSFHQDFPFLPFDRTGSLTIWIALIDIAPDMGPLRYLEGSHRLGPLGRFMGADPRDDYAQLRDCPVAAGEFMRAGDAQVHWDLTMHGAAPNRSDQAREAYAMRFIRSDTIYTGAPHPHFDNLGIKGGSPFTDCPGLFRVNANGLVDA